MKKEIHSGGQKASALGKARAERSAHVMNPEYLAEIENFRLMDDTFMSKCLENAPECIDILKRQVSQFKNSEEGRRTMCKAMEKIKAKGKRENMLETAKRLLANGKLMLKEIAECCGLSLAEVKKLQASMA